MDYGVGMNTEMRLRVQETLDELHHERLIPFALTAYNIFADVPGEFVVPFYDSRVHSFRFSWTPGELPFKEVVRTAVLSRVRNMDSPPNGWLA